MDTELEARKTTVPTKSQRAFEILCRENTRMLMVYLRSFLRNEATVDDLFQETLIVAWRRLDRCDLKPAIWSLATRDRRARGMGGSLTDPFCSCAEENLLAYDGDPYSTENILIHELAHNIHLRGMVNVDPTFDQRLEETYKAPWRRGYGKACMPARITTSISLRACSHGLTTIASRIMTIIMSIHARSCWNTTRRWLPSARKFPATPSFDTPNRRHDWHGHLAGYDPSQAPTFKWPARLLAAGERVQPRDTANGFPIGYFYLTNRFVEGQNLVLESSPVTLRKRGKYTGMYWKAIPAGGGYFYLTSQFFEERKQVLESGIGAGTAVMMPKEGKAGTLWKAVPAGDGYHYLTTMFMEKSKKVLEGNVGEANANLRDPFKGRPHMVTRLAAGTLWKFVPVEPF